VLEEARSINRYGAIVGSGRFNGQPRAFLAVPAWVIGKRVPRPQGVVARKPEIDLLLGATDDRADNAFFFSPAISNLFAVRPVMARLRWYVSNDPADTNRVATVGFNIWPKDPTIHIAESPADLEPKDTPFTYRFNSLLYATAPGVLADANAKTFQATRRGYEVLLYLNTGSTDPNVYGDPTVHPPFLNVVRTLLWTDRLIDNVPAFVGQAVRDPAHQEYARQNGFVFFEKAFYDGDGPDRAYDRATRLGPILPVNGDLEGVTNDLVVVWYRTNRIGVAWPSVPIRYNVAWLDDPAHKIIIASTLGSGPLDPNVYQDMRVYNQPARARPGYNPNEEHALLVPSSSGLRDDLNVFLGQSEPFAMLKYREAATGEWRIQPFRVVAEEAPYFFRYTGEAGTEIQPPFPLTILPVCPESYGVSGPYWELGRLPRKILGQGRRPVRQQRDGGAAVLLPAARRVLLRLRSRRHERCGGEHLFALARPPCRRRAGPAH
jgi:hypothetical protein